MNYLPTKGGLTVHGILSGGGGFHPTGQFHDVGGVPTYYKDIEKPEVLVPHDYGLSLNATGKMVKKPHKPSRYVSFNEVERKPGVFPTTIGDMGGSGLGIDSYHQFKPAEGLAEAMALANAQQEQASAPHQWVKPEHMMYTGDKTAESARDYMMNVSQDFQRAKIEKLIAKGFSEEEIKKVLDKEREKAVERALADPSNPTVLLQAELAKSLPDYLQPDYPVKIAPGAVPLKKDADFYQLATNSMTPVQRNKKLQARDDAKMVKEMEKAAKLESKALEKEFRAQQKKKMQSTVSEIPTGSGVLDYLRKNNMFPNRSEDPLAVSFD